MIRAVGVVIAVASVLATVSCSGVDTKAVCRDLGSDDVIPFMAAQPPGAAPAPLQQTPAEAQAFHEAAAKLRGDGKRAGGSIEAAADRVAAVYDKAGDAITVGVPYAELGSDYASADNALSTACGGANNMASP